MFQEGFPNSLRNDVTKAVRLIPHETYSNVAVGISEDFIQYFQDNNVIRFPYRIYYLDSPNEVIRNLSERQKKILHCIYSRSCDGHVRQKHMSSLLELDYEDWAIPYIVKICDEYVVEILEMIYDTLKEQDTERIKKFCLENIESFCISYNRMISYWNEYYRYKHKNFHQYLGRKLCKRQTQHTFKNLNIYETMRASQLNWRLPYDNKRTASQGLVSSSQGLSSE